ncbi:hypothetical protein Ade02nite_20750 [Paractinoplanes deccanensis]|uniref:Uncharacterized protein n=1 Tax=Paractinoplanes deccanensis TaxID=113561 RepID=A0ABQ3Y0A2_9ACTN|nr:hypothetical protein [Actinoplanes deccanensis]GID73434.1 hypothetical protein Ade02nite_20750 [Actinoplanes deccanensis]
MNAVDALNLTIARTDATADLYGVTPAELDAGAKTLAGLDWQERNAFAASSVLGTIVAIAGEHQAECRRPDCRTCDAVRSGLATTLAGLRTLKRETIDRGRAR